MFSLLCVVCVHQSKSARTQLRLPDSRGPSDRRTVVNSTWRWMAGGVQGGGAFSDKCPTISDQHGGQWSASPIIDEPDTDTTTTDWDTSGDMAGIPTCDMANRVWILLAYEYGANKHATPRTCKHHLQQAIPAPAPHLHTSQWNVWRRLRICIQLELK